MTSDSEVRELATLLNKNSLACRITQGEVLSVEGPTCTVTIEGGTTPVPNFTWLADAYAPIVGDIVWIIDGGPGAKFILGTTGSRTNDWQAATLLNSWTNDTAAAGWSISQGFIVLTGVVKRASAPSFPAPLFNTGVPAPFYQNHPIAVSGGLASVYYDTSGQVGLWSVSGNPHLDSWLDGVRLRMQ